MAESERRITVLVVDDDPDMRMIETLMLQLSADIKVVAEAIDGIDALEKFRQLDGPPIPDVVLLGNRMSGMNGIEVATHLLNQVPVQRIILFSANLNDSIVAQARDLGISRVISKDDIGDLAEIVLQIHNSNS